MHIPSIAVSGLAARAQANSVSDALSATPTATISAGVIVGTTTSIANATAGVNQFLGIPYAADPTGTLRFKPPQPTSWSSPISTTKFGNSCIQVFAGNSSTQAFAKEVFNTPAPTENENCLFINVFAPRKAWDPSAPSYPVLYWIYGGAWQFGNSGQPEYDGSHFAALEDVIVVSVNYRTNVFGLPTSPQITNRTERNVGLLDQRRGLEWIQENIAAFGGNSSAVTVFGQSAGAYSIDILITSYSSTSSLPFQAAIMQSGTYAYLPLGQCSDTDTSADFSSWSVLVYYAGCSNATDQLACMQSVDASTIRTIEEAGVGFGQTCDEITYVNNPRERHQTGNVASVPIIAGSNTWDGSFYVAAIAGLSPNTFDFVNGTMTKNTTLTKEVLAAYPLGSNGRSDNFTQATQIYTDWYFHCPTVFTASDSTKYEPTYRYIFNATFPNTRITGEPRWPVQDQGAWHTSEIPLVFSTYNVSTATTAEITLSNIMRGAWASFAKDPYSAPISGWPRVGSQTADTFDFGTDGAAGTGAVEDGSNCSVWRDYYVSMHQ